VILADESTVTGSIGVLNIWLHTRGFYEKIGASKDVFLRGDRADFMPTWREVTDEEIDLVQYYVDKYYNKFVADVSRGRGMTVEEVHEVAQGRIWSGRQAERIGLVDRIGGLTKAIDIAKKEAGIPRDEDVEFKILPKPGGLFEALASSMAARVAGDVSVPGYLKDLARDASYLDAFDEPVLYLMPYRIEVE
jgi:protease-4